jgi:hypothetical protein
VCQLVPARRFIPVRRCMFFPNYGDKKDNCRELEKFGISFKIEARKKILPQAYT